MADARGEDEGKNEKIIRRIMDQVINFYPQPNYIIFPGDLIMGSKKPHRIQEQLEYFKGVFKEYLPIELFLPTVGNHDVGSSAEDNTKEKIFAKVFSEFKANNFLEGYNRTAYYIDIGNTRLIVLNTYHADESNQIRGRQLKWFNIVSSESKQYKLVFLHSPAYPTGHHIDSSLDIYPEKRDRFWNVVDKNNIDLVFTGHEHNYSRRIIDSSFSTENYQFKRGVTQIVTGGAGGPLMDTFEDRRGVIVPPISLFHYVIVDVYGDNLNVTAVSLEGDVIDRFIIYPNS
jgi:hypothetical protein